MKADLMAIDLAEANRDGPGAVEGWERTNYTVWCFLANQAKSLKSV
jgi:hypothetical protein